MATSAHTITSANNAKAPISLRIRMDMLRHCSTKDGGTIWVIARAASTHAMTDVETIARHRHAVRTWLYAVAALIVLTLVVGGATRLTESGLSITEWKPVTGVLPPLSAL